MRTLSLTVMLGLTALSAVIALPAAAGGVTLTIRFGTPPAHRQVHQRHPHRHHSPRHATGHFGNPAAIHPAHPQVHQHHPGSHGPTHAARFPAHPIAGGATQPPARPAPRVVIIPVVRYVPSAPRVIYAASGMQSLAAPVQVPMVLNNAPAYALDGDTFDAGGVRYRLNGIDTPELYEPRGREARERLQALLRGGSITVIPVARDAYGRVVAEVLVAGVNVAAVLRAEGFAK